MPREWQDQFFNCFFIVSKTCKMIGCVPLFPDNLDTESSIIWPGLVGEYIATQLVHVPAYTTVGHLERILYLHERGAQLCISPIFVSVFKVIYLNYFLSSIIDRSLVFNKKGEKENK